MVWRWPPTRSPATTGSSAGRPSRARSPSTTTRGRRATTPTSTRGPTRRRRRSAGILVAAPPAPARSSTSGAGPAWSARRCASCGYDGRLVGLDISSVSLRLARESGAYDEARDADLQRPLPLDTAARRRGGLRRRDDLPRRRSRRCGASSRASSPRRARRRDPARGPVGAAPLPGRRRPARGGRRLDTGRRHGPAPYLPRVRHALGESRLLLRRRGGRLIVVRRVVAAHLAGGREVAAQVGADSRMTVAPASANRAPAAVPATAAGDPRRRVEADRGTVGDGVDQADPLLASARPPTTPPTRSRPWDRRRAARCRPAAVPRPTTRRHRTRPARWRRSTCRAPGR